MENYVRGKTIIITGGGSGFGKMTADRVANLGAQVICADINEEAAKKTVYDIKNKGFEASFIKTDVTNKKQVDDMAEFAIDTYGRIDVLLNSAGIMPLSFFSDHDMAWNAWDKCIDINLKGVIWSISAVYDQMIKQGNGHIINITSIYDAAPVVGSAVYQASKIGVKYITDCLRQETQGKIKVSLIRPVGVLDTGLQKSVLNRNASVGIYGQNFDSELERRRKMEEGIIPADMKEINSIKFWRMPPEPIVEQIIYCINQPMGINISDCTIRTSGELFVI